MVVVVAVVVVVVVVFYCLFVCFLRHREMRRNKNTLATYLCFHFILTPHYTNNFYSSPVSSEFIGYLTIL